MIQVKKIINGKFYLLDDEKYFFIHFEGKCFAIRDKCPHRNGPLSLGKICETSQSIVCPWHENKIKIKALIIKSLSGVKVCDSIYLLSETKI